MADISNINRGANPIKPPADDQVIERDVPRIPTSGTKTEFPVGQPEKSSAGANNLVPNQRVSTDTGIGREGIQFDPSAQIGMLGGVSATDKLLGLDLRPTMTGILAPPPGNSEFLRHLSPQARRAIMRKLLNKQRDKLRRLARYVRDRRDEEENQKSEDEESFLEVISESTSMELVPVDRSQISRATGELEKAALMLNVLDELLAMQDYTISQMGTFSQG